MTKPTYLGNQINLIDLFDLGMKERTGSYVIKSEEITVIETSASPSIPHLLKGLEDLHIDPNDIKHIIVTHIHLDHAGGVGLFLEHCPNARLYVHSRGKRHLVDPSNLIAGARSVYGAAFDTLFNPILPVAENRLIIKEDGDTLQIGENRTLIFYDTPGHAKHHFSIHDSGSNGIFTGDTIGILYPITLPNGDEFILPTTSPNHFDPEEMLRSLDKIEKLQVEKIYFGHYGMSENTADVYKQMTYWVPKFVEAGEQIMVEFSDSNFKDLSNALAKRLLIMVQNYLREKDITDNHDIYMYLKMDMQVCAMGIIDYLTKKY